jgi:hypothetical protein
MKMTTVLLAIMGVGLGYQAAASDPPVEKTQRGEKTKELATAPAAALNHKSLDRAATPPPAATLTPPVTDAMVTGNASHRGSSTQTNAAPEQAQGQEPFAPVKSSLSAAPNDRALLEPGKYGGLMYDLFKVPDVYALFDFSAPVHGDDLESNATHDLLSGRPNGICFFKIKFGSR